MSYWHEPGPYEMTPEPSFGEKCAKEIMQMNAVARLQPIDESVVAKVIDDLHAREGKALERTGVTAEASRTEPGQSNPSPAQPDEYDVHGKRRERWFEEWNPTPAQSQGEWTVDEQGGLQMPGHITEYLERATAEVIAKHRNSDLAYFAIRMQEQLRTERLLVKVKNIELAAVRAERDAWERAAKTSLIAQQELRAQLANLQTPSLGGK